MTSGIAAASPQQRANNNPPTPNSLAALGHLSLAPSRRLGPAEVVSGCSLSRLSDLRGTEAPGGGRGAVLQGYERGVAHEDEGQRSSRGRRGLGRQVFPLTALKWQESAGISGFFEPQECS